jgi:hypothetical protein
MKNKNINYLLKYASPYRLWVIDVDNKLLELKCPFKVKAIDRIKSLNENEFYLVSKLQLSERLTIVYLINNKLFHYYHFEISI